MHWSAHTPAWFRLIKLASTAQSLFMCCENSRHDWQNIKKATRKQAPKVLSSFVLQNASDTERTSMGGKLANRWLSPRIIAKTKLLKLMRLTNKRTTVSLPQATHWQGMTRRVEM